VCKAPIFEHVTRFASRHFLLANQKHVNSYTVLLVYTRGGVRNKPTRFCHKFVK